MGSSTGAKILVNIALNRNAGFRDYDLPKPTMTSRNAVEINKHPRSIS
jgi:hypothetical protein